MYKHSKTDFIVRTDEDGNEIHDRYGGTCIPTRSTSGYPYSGSNRPRLEFGPSCLVKRCVQVYDHASMLYHWVPIEFLGTADDTPFELHLTGDAS